MESAFSIYHRPADRRFSVKTVRLEFILALLVTVTIATFFSISVFVSILFARAMTLANLLIVKEDTDIFLKLK